MPTRNIHLSEELDRFVVARVESGRYDNASEVMRAALRSLELQEEEQHLKRVSLVQALEEGLASGIAEGDVFARVRRNLRLPADRE